MVTGSSVVRNVERRGVERNVEVSENLLNYVDLGTVPHDLTLDVRLPGRAPFEVTVREKVPAKATGRHGLELPVGVELPVKAGATPEHVEIDWKAFLASPDRKAAVSKAASDASYAAAKQYTDSVPGMKEQTWAGSAAGLPSWMEWVRQGKLKRKEFDQQVDMLARIGQMDPELAAEGKRTLDAEGY